MVFKLAIKCSGLIVKADTKYEALEGRNVSVLSSLMFSSGFFKQAENSIML